MALPVGWPPRPASSLRSIRFFTSGTTTGAFSDNAFLFKDGAGANTLVPTPDFPLEIRPLSHRWETSPISLSVEVRAALLLVLGLIRILRLFLLFGAVRSEFLTTVLIRWSLVSMRPTCTVGF